MGSPVVFLPQKYHFFFFNEVSKRGFQAWFDTALLGGILAVRLAVATHETRVKYELLVEDELWMGAWREM